MVIGFLAGFGPFKLLIETFNQSIVQKDSYILLKDINKDYVLRSEFKRFVPKQHTRKEKVILLENLILDGENILKKTGNDFINSYLQWYNEADELIRNFGIEFPILDGFDSTNWYQGNYPKTENKYRACLNGGIGK